MIEGKKNTSLIQKLRAETHEEHKKTEDSPLMAQLMSGNFSLLIYQELLTRLLLLYTPLEAKIKDIITHQAIDYHYEQKCSFLQRDLVHTQSDLSNINIKPIPLNFLCDKASFLGVLYVIEGSTLGGALIRKSMAKHINVDLMATFFYPYRSLTRMRWDKTCAFIERYAEEQQLNFDVISDASIHTFQLIREVLND